MEHERELNFAKRNRAAENLTWMRRWEGCRWTDEEMAMITAMLGLDDIDPDDRPTSDVYTWSPGENGSK